MALVQSTSSIHTGRSLLVQPDKRSASTCRRVKRTRNCVECRAGPAEDAWHISRRQLVGASTIAVAADVLGAGMPAAADTFPCPPSWLVPIAPNAAAYVQRGPFDPVDLPRLQHTCVSCFPACVGDQCLLDIHVTYPKGGTSLGLRAPYPLAIFTGGFVVGSTAYRETAAHLASWGYTVVRYDTRDVLPSPCDDVTHVALLRELISWTSTHPLLRQIADPSAVYLAGHSRGGKLSTLAAAQDPRVKALCLLDPVDVTQYAPLSERFPSAVAALQDVANRGRFLPVAVIGSGRASDCAPGTSNFQHFYAAAPSAAWAVVLGDAGHFQFLDDPNPLHKAVCGAGAPEGDRLVRLVSRSVLVAWGELMVRRAGHDVLSALAARHCSAGGTSDLRSFTSPWASIYPWSPVEAGPAEAALIPTDASTSSGLWGQPSTLGGSSSSTTTTTSSSSSSSAGERMLLGSSAGGPVGGGPDPQTGDAAAAAAAGSSLPSSGLPLTQSPLAEWAAPAPADLQEVRLELQRLVTSLSYQAATLLEVTSSFKNFG